MIDRQGRVFPDFLIVGSMRAGSTYLRRVLSGHPRIDLLEDEVNFFGSRRNWKRGMDWYARHFAGAPKNVLVGEKSVAYSYRPAAQPPVPRRIAELLPDVRLIWTLRDPVERTYSQYWHAVRNGQERLSFEAALESRVAPDWRAYRDRSVYVHQVRSFLDVFPIERIHFIEFGALTRQPNETVAEVCAFLGIDSTVMPAHGASDARSRNAGSRPRSFALSSVLSRMPARLRRMIRKRVKGWNNARTGYPPMRPETREELVAFFEPYNAELEALIGVNTTGWGAPLTRS